MSLHATKTAEPFLTHDDTIVVFVDADRKTQGALSVDAQKARDIVALEHCDFAPFNGLVSGEIFTKIDS